MESVSIWWMNTDGVQPMKIYEATEQAYKNGYEKGKADALKWIPVTEMLPEEMEKVMAFVNGVRITAVLKGGVWLSSWNHDVVDDEVTHWCALPQPPK